MITFNKEKVTHIKITDLIKTDYIWHDERKKVKKLFGLITLKEGYKAGFYKGDPTSLFTYSIDEAVEGSININGIFYWLPVIEVYINNERVGLKYFDTIEEAKSFCEKEFPNVKYKL